MANKIEVNPCLGYDCYDPDLGCLIPGTDRFYACPLLPDPDPDIFLCAGPDDIDI